MTTAGSCLYIPSVARGVIPRNHVSRLRRGEIHYIRFQHGVGQIYSPLKNMAGYLRKRVQLHVQVPDDQPIREPVAAALLSRPFY